MSGAASISAAKKRRTKSTNGQPQVSPQKNTNTNIIPPKMSVQQSFNFIWNKLVEQNKTIHDLQESINNNASNEKIGGTPPDSDGIKMDLSNIQVRLGEFEEALNKTGNGKGPYVSVKQFNTVMSQIGNDITELTEKSATLGEYITNLQNNNIVLRNQLDKLENGSNNLTDALMEEATPDVVEALMKEATPDVVNMVISNNVDVETDVTDQEANDQETNDEETNDQEATDQEVTN